MSRITRRDFVYSVGALGAATSVLGWPALGQAKAGGRVVVIGGGFGGASCAIWVPSFPPQASSSTASGTAVVR